MKSLAKFEHENIVRLYGSGVEPQPFMVMELHRGITVREILREGGRVDFTTAICWGIQVASALDAAHRGRIHHRDIKPENLMVDDQGDVKILDFGIARDAGSRTADRMGSLWYMSPEMVLHKPTDHRSDLYALGVVLYELLTARRPWSVVDEANEKQVQAAHACLDPDPIPALVPECPEPLWDIVSRLLEKDPAKRYADAGALMGALLDVLRISAPPGHPLSRAVERAFVRKKLRSVRPSPASSPETDPPESDEPPAHASPQRDEPPAGASRPSGPRPVEAEPAPQANGTRDLGPGFVPHSPCAPRQEPVFVPTSTTVPLPGSTTLPLKSPSGKVYVAAVAAPRPAAPTATASLPRPDLPRPMRAPFPLARPVTAELPVGHVVAEMRAPFPLARPVTAGPRSAARRQQTARIAARIAVVAAILLGAAAFMAVTVLLATWLVIHVLHPAPAPAAPQSERQVSP